MQLMIAAAPELRQTACAARLPVANAAYRLEGGYLCALPMPRSLQGGALLLQKAQEVLDALKEKLGDSYGCDLAEDESRMTGYYELDMSKIDNWAAESSENSALDPSTAVVLKVKDGYAQDAAALLQTGYQQVLDYCRMYSMNVAQVEQARLFVSGDYVALLILGQGPDDSTADEAKLAQDEAAKVDAAWQDIFGSAANQLVVK